MRNHLLRTAGREGRFDLLFTQNIFLLLFLLSSIQFSLVNISANGYILVLLQLLAKLFISDS